MKRNRGSFWMILLMLGWSNAQEPGGTPVLSDQSSQRQLLELPRSQKKLPQEPWLGVSISKPGDALYAQLTKVPKGVGFLIDQVELGGPAMVAGLTQYDVLWKLNDQLLINQGQFLALLAMYEVGDQISLTYFRGGENFEVEVTLVARPKHASGLNQAQIALLLPGVSRGGPTQILDYLERTASVNDQEGVVKVKKRGREYHWEQLDSEGKEVAHGRFAEPDASGKLDLPEELVPVLKSKLSALVRAYEAATERAGSRVRVPRVRRVPTPEKER